MSNVPLSGNSLPITPILDGVRPSTMDFMMHINTYFQDPEGYLFYSHISSLDPTRKVQYKITRLINPSDNKPCCWVQFWSTSINNCHAEVSCSSRLFFMQKPILFFIQLVSRLRSGKLSLRDSGLFSLCGIRYSKRPCKVVAWMAIQLLATGRTLP